jgi:hypothetical protein
MRAYARSFAVAAAVAGIIGYLVATRTEPSGWLFTVACCALVAMTIVADGWRVASARWQSRYEADHRPGPPLDGRRPVRPVIRIIGGTGEHEPPDR